MFSEFDVISIYTRAEAIEDGFLVAVEDSLLQEAGFKFPVAIQHDVWDLYVKWDKEDDSKQTYQDQIGRLWDLLMMLKLGIRLSKDSSSLKFMLFVIPRDGKSKKPKKVILYSSCHAGDDFEPVITVSMKEGGD